MPKHDIEIPDLKLLCYLFLFPLFFSFRRFINNLDQKVYKAMGFETIQKMSFRKKKAPFKFAHFFVATYI